MFSTGRMYQEVPSMQTVKKILHRQKLIIVLTVAAGLLRFWNISETFSFLGDQGRDAMIVADIFRFFDFVFIGPVTSVGNMYLGPLYYYFMLPFLYITYPSPIGPALAVAFLGTLYVLLLYMLGKELVGKRAALFAMTLAVFNTTLIEYSRFSWNPNPAPLLSLIALYAVFKTYTGKYWYWLVGLVAWAVLVQLHYITLVMGVALGLMWVHQLYTQYTLGKTQNVLAILKATLVSILVALMLYSPLVAFDYKHNWLNAQAFTELLSSADNFTQAREVSFFEKASTLIKETHGRGMQMFFEVRIGNIRWLNTVALLALTLFFVYGYKKKKFGVHAQGVHILLVFAITAIFGLSAYQHSVFRHYILYLFPITSLLLGVVFALLWKYKYIGRTIVISFFLLFFLKSDIIRHLQTPVFGVKSIQAVSETIANRVVPGEKYNIVLLAHSGDIDGQNYRYFLTTTDTPPVRIEQRGEVETLFIINEDKVMNRVVDSPVYEIVVFPNKEPAEVYQTFDGRGPEITVLRK